MSCYETKLITASKAMNSLLKHMPEIATSNVRKVVDTINKLAHDYDHIENLQVWSIIIKHLPLLKT